MANLGQGLLTIGGALVGSLFGAPQLGLLLGSYAGQLLFPTKLPGVQGPRLKELNVQTSTVGVPIPIVYGTYALAGNVIWSGGLIEQVDTDDVGGKGGGPSQEVKTYTYFADFAVGVCEGEIQGVRRIWADAVVIYDLSPQADDESDTDYSKRIATSQQTAALMTVYVGDETQVADPLIESYEGAGRVPAYRGLAYVLFERLPLAAYGNRIPNLRFEVYTGSASAVDCTQYSAGNLEPWLFAFDSSVYEPRNPLNVHEYRYTEVGGHAWTTRLGALADINGDTDHPAQPFIMGEPGFGETYVHGWGTSSTPNDIAPCEIGGGSEPDPGADYVSVFLEINSLAITDRTCSYDVTGAPGVTCVNWNTFLGGKYNPRYVTSGQFSGVVTLVDPGDSPVTVFGGVPDSSADTIKVTIDCSGVPGNADLWRLQTHEMQCRRSTTPPDPCSFGTPIANAPGYCVVDGEVIQAVNWVYTAGTWHVLRAYADDGVFVTSYPLSPARQSTHPEYNDQDFWEAAYADAVAAGDIEAGLVYGVDYPESQAFAYVGTCDTEAIDTVCVPVADVVEDVCTRVGLTSIDVSDLNSCVDGYCITRVMSGRDAIDQLRTYGLFDAVESGVTLKFIERGHTAVATLTADDLGAHEASQERPPVVEISRVQEKELPRRLRLHYASPDRNYEPGEQAASRITTEAISENDIELAISMADDNAAQLAEILLYDTWISRNSYRTQTDNSWLELEPTDCIIIPIDGQDQRVRIVATDYSIGGILRLECVRDDDGSYISAATGHPPSSSGGGGSSALVCPSAAVYLDLPGLRSTDTDAGYYAAVYGLCDTWTCAAIYRSSDGGISYARVASTQTQATVGTIDHQDTAGNLYLTLDTLGATLSSITTSQIAAGQNVAAIGSDGAWEIIQYQTATLLSGGVWELSDLTRGLQTTTEVTAAEGDRFVLLSPPGGLLRIAETCLATGVEKQLKVVSCGESLSDVTAVDFTTQGLSCRPDLISPDPPDSSTPVSNTNCATILIWNPLTEQYEPGPLRIFDACDLENDTSSYAVGDHLVIVDQDSSGPIFGILPDTGGGGGSGVTDGDKGDITISGSGATYTIDNDVVTYAKIQNVAGFSIPAKATTGSGDLADLTAGNDTVLGKQGSGNLAFSTVATAQIADAAVTYAKHQDVAGLSVVGRSANSTGVSAAITGATAGHVLQVIAGPTVGFAALPSTAGGAMTYLGSSTVTGAAATDLTISGLDLSLYSSFYFELNLDNGSGSTASLSLYINSDTTATNYNEERITSSVGTGGSTGGNDAIFAAPTTTQSVTLSGFLRRNFDGFVRAAFNSCRGTSAQRVINYGYLMWETSANVTGLTVHSSVATSISIGSTIKVWGIF